MVKRLALGLVVLASASAAVAAPGVNVTVKGTRVHLGDLVVGLAPEVAGVDMGPSPASTGTRVITHDEIAEALHDHGIDGSTTLPSAVRVHRKLKTLDAAAIGRIVS